MDIFTSTLTSSGEVTDNRSRVRGIYYVAGGTAGSVQIRDGGASGTIKINIATPASATATQWIDFPGRGVVFGTDVYVTISNVTSVMVVYE